MGNSSTISARDNKHVYFIKNLAGRQT